MLIAREEHPVDRAPGPLEAGTRIRAGEDHHIARRHPHDQFARHRPLKVVPEVVDQQHARLKTVEREHQRRRLAMHAQATEGQVQVV
ncbi:MAG TPA: hypothetical protein VF462_07090 [Micromonosporaceae bacterium]